MRNHNACTSPIRHNLVHSSRSIPAQQCSRNCHQLVCVGGRFKPPEPNKICFCSSFSSIQGSVRTVGSSFGQLKKGFPTSCTQSRLVQNTCTEMSDIAHPLRNSSHGPTYPSRANDPRIPTLSIEKRKSQITNTKTVSLCVPTSPPSFPSPKPITPTKSECCPTLNIS